MTASNIGSEQLAEQGRLLYEAELNRRPIAPPNDLIERLRIEGAYEIQRAFVDLKKQSGARPVGRKIGLTSKAMQEMLGVDQPDFGVLLDDMEIHDGKLAMDELIAPRVEAEIAFVLDKPLSGADVTEADVLAATRHVVPALEIIDSRVADWNIKIEDTIADNASFARFVLGDPKPLSEIDLLAESATATVGDNSVTGNGAAVLGHPARAVVWLAQALAPFGEGIEAGDVVLSGAVAAALPFAAGDLIRAEYSTLGTLEVQVS